MLNSKEFEEGQRRNVEQRRAFIKRWAKYVRTHDDEGWSRQQNTLIDSQLQAANELAEQGETDPVRFAELKDRPHE
jgi:acyl-CoA reductase-like NAD-dependent aldehyde dehydrogenase